MSPERYWPSSAFEQIADLGWESAKSGILDTLKQQEGRLRELGTQVSGLATDALSQGWQPVSGQEQALLAVPEPAPLETPALPAWETLVSQWLPQSQPQQPAAMPQASSLPGGWEPATGREPEVPAPAPARQPTPSGVPQAMPQASASPIAAGAPDQFVGSAASYARAAEAESGIPAVLNLAVAANESGWGKHAPGGAYHGIQAQAGEEGVAYTDYRPDGTPYRARLRSFGPGESFRGFARFLQENPRYHPALERYRQTGNVEQLVDDISAAGYNEGGLSGPWAGQIKALIRQIDPLLGQAPAPAQPARSQPAAMPEQASQPARAPTRYQPGELTPNQYEASVAEGLDDETAWAVCGPAAAIAFARRFGRNPTMREAVDLARQVGWTVERGMAGPASQKALLDKLGVSSRLVEGAPDWQAVAEDVQRGNPVTISTPGHYFVAERYDPQTGMFDFGQSAAILKASGGRRWFKPEEIDALGMGSPRATLYLDNPASPTPSAVAGPSPTAAPAAPDAGARRPLPTPAGGGPPPAAAGPGSGDDGGPSWASLPPSGASSVRNLPGTTVATSASTTLPAPSGSPMGDGSSPASMGTPPGTSDLLLRGPLQPYAEEIGGETPPPAPFADPTVTDAAYTQPAAPAPRVDPDPGGMGWLGQDATSTPVVPDIPPPPSPYAPGQAESMETRPDRFAPTPTYGPVQAAPGEPDVPPAPQPATATGRLVEAATAPAARVYEQTIREAQADEDAIFARDFPRVAEFSRETGIPLEQAHRAVRIARDILLATPQATADTIDASLKPLGLGRETVGIDLPVVGRIGLADIIDLPGPGSALTTLGVGRSSGMAVRGAPSAVQRALGQRAVEYGEGALRTADLPVVGRALPDVPILPGAGTIERGTGAAVGAARTGLEAVGRGAARLGRELGEEGARQLLDLTPTPRMVESTGGGIPIPRDPTTRLQAARAALTEVSQRLTQADEAVQRAEQVGTQAEFDAAWRAYAAVRREYDAAARALDDAGRAIAAQDQRIEQAGFGRPVERADLGQSDASLLPERPGGPIPRVVDDTPRTPGLNAALPIDPASAAAGGAAVAIPGEDGEEPDPLQAAGGMLVAGILGRRFPGAQRAIQAAAARQARMTVRGIQPLSPLRWTGELVKSIGYSSMIGPPTATVNVLGNLLEPLWAAPKETVRAIRRGNPREAGEMLLGSFYGLTQTGREMLDALAARGRYASNPDQPRLSERTVNPVGHSVAAGLEAGGRVFSALPDAFFGTIARHAGDARAAAQIATDEGLTGTAWKSRVQALLTDAQTLRRGGTPANRADATRVMGQGDAYADRQTFRDDLGTWGKGASRLAGRDVPVLGTFLTPFFTTPWNMGLRLLERTPVGAVMNTQRGFDKAYDAVVGTALIAGLVVGPAAAGRITGSGPGDAEQRKMLEAEGWKPYHTLIQNPADGQDYYVPNRVFGIYGKLLNAVGDAHDALAYQKPDETARARITDAGKRLGRLVKEEPYLQGLADLLAVFDSAGSGLEGFAASNLARLVPYAATARTVGTALDPAVRETDRGAETPILTSIGQRTQANLGQRQDLPVAQDVLGRPRENPQQGLGAVLPLISQRRPDPTVQAFREAGVDIGQPRDALTLDGLTIPLSPDEQRAWQRHRGAVLERVTPGLTTRGWWGNSRAREAALRDVLQQANAAADQRVIREIGAAELRRRAREAAQKRRVS